VRRTPALAELGLVLIAVGLFATIWQYVARPRVAASAPASLAIPSNPARVKNDKPSSRARGLARIPQDEPMRRRTP
jgi:hypothetical protein